MSRRASRSSYRYNVERNPSADEDSLYIDVKEAVDPPQAPANIATIFDTQWEDSQVDKPYDLTPVGQETGFLQANEARDFTVDPYEFSGAGEEQQRMLAHESPIPE